MSARQMLRLALTWMLALGLVLTGAPTGKPCDAAAANTGCTSCCCAEGGSCCGEPGDTACGCDHGQPLPSRGVASAEQRIELAPAEGAQPRPVFAAADEPRAAKRRTPAHGLRPYRASSLHVELSVFLI